MSKETESEFIGADPMTQALMDGQALANYTNLQTFVCYTEEDGWIALEQDQIDDILDIRVSCLPFGSPEE